MKQAQERTASKTSLGVLIFLITASMTFNVYFWHENLQVNMGQISRLCGQPTTTALANLKGERLYKQAEVESLRTTKLAAEGWKPELEKTDADGVIVKEGAISMAILYVNDGKVTKIARLRR